MMLEVYGDDVVQGDGRGECEDDVEVVLRHGSWVVCVDDGGEFLGV